MKFFYYLLASLILSTGVTSVYAANNAPPSDTQLTNEAEKKQDSSVPSGDNTDITIIQKKDAVVEEFRVNGKLRYAKITPKNDPPYYMYDSNGDGILDATENDPKKAEINQWILMKW